MIYDHVFFSLAQLHGIFDDPNQTDVAARTDSSPDRLISKLELGRCYVDYAAPVGIPLGVHVHRTEDQRRTRPTERSVRRKCPKTPGSVLCLFGCSRNDKGTTVEGETAVIVTEDVEIRHNSIDYR
ncbi:hypothetical protein GWI33_008474 [Rhynchophorus ferrugineus]|uniref:Uncharacterized protein n=1 Tax=Rhynchophorus ferrugineus TaxID=354439 RepID=A0A834ICX0_RHYFE|nr:hypothetical protein GWI33_008474 [Rhynchophorus ferrugineus]